MPKSGNPPRKEALSAADRADMQRQAAFNMARRAVPGAFGFPLVCLILALGSPFFRDHGVAAVGLISASLAGGVLRLYLVWRFQSGAWRHIRI